MIEQLFGSKTRVKLLQLFCSNPNRSFYVREITRKIDEQINSVRRELANLLSIGIISSDNADNNRLYYEVNQDYEHYKALAAIFGGQKLAAATATEEKGSDSLKPLKAIGNIDLALLTGVFTRDDVVSVDFVVVGDINQTQLDKYVADFEAKEGKEIRYTSMTHDDYVYRKQINDRFLSTVMAAKKQILIDKHGEFTEKKPAEETKKDPKTTKKEK
jgi:hypothetical protein